MATSPISPPATLQSALAAAQAEFPSIPKSKTATIKIKTGGEYSYHYADLSDILRVILPILGKHGLSVVQPLKRNAERRLCVTTRLMFGDAFVESDGLVIPEGLDPRELGSVLTYWRRYDFCSLLVISPDEDTDGAGGARPKPQATRVTPPVPSANPAKVTTQEVLAYVVDVVDDVGKKTKTKFQWITLAIAGIGDQEKAICEDSKLFDVATGLRGKDAVLHLRRDPAMSYPRVMEIRRAVAE